MSGLPSGTVSLLFSDVEGSTVLLNKLGTEYTDALDGHRGVQRRAWIDHGGIELGTEGDSFYVVFDSAEAAVAAATQAQRELAAYPWPQGELVQVRMGIHSGSPTPHAAAYVGMDVHLAARVAAAAHGGQVVVSGTTAELVGGCVPSGARLRDLGSHQLKDIPEPERLFQVTIDGLPAEFPALKTLGTASSLPAQASPLVGRDGEMAELAAVLGTPGVRLVTLTGPGGSGKTRLAIGVAHGLTQAFPDGVYFVPLATVSTGEVMWTSIAEVLDVPPEGRIPPDFFTHVAHRSALFVLDNLEQLVGADAVVAELLSEAPNVVVVATSRRPLHVSGEHEHPVPPLELPVGEGVDAVGRAGAVQLFVQRAEMVRSAFALDSDNVADVAAVCRRLDGLPLALELAAARTKLLGPRALLARLDKALDLAASGTQVPSRQKTLRDTIAWSYELLAPQQQAFFVHLGVFSGGADLEAIAGVAVDADTSGGRDVLDLVAELVDVNLATVTETTAGEPRIRLLETIRSFALDELAARSALDEVRRRHAQHYLGLAKELCPELEGRMHLEVRARLDTEHDNIREALAWALPRDPPASDSAARIMTGLSLCSEMTQFWDASGYFSEGRRWLALAIDRGGARDTAELARCLQVQADWQRLGRNLDNARECAAASVAMWRRLGGRGLTRALNAMADIEMERGQAAAARTLFEEAIALGRQSGDSHHLHVALGDLAYLEAAEGNYERSLELRAEAVDIALDLADPVYSLKHRHNMACLLRQMGRVDEAYGQMRDVVPQALTLKEQALLVCLPEDFGAILAELGRHDSAVRLLGAADTLRDRIALPRAPLQEAEIAAPIAKTRAALTAEHWEEVYRAGRNMAVDSALAVALDADAP